MCRRARFFDTGETTMETLMSKATTSTVPAPPSRAPLAIALWAAAGFLLAVSGILTRVEAIAPAFVFGSVALWGASYRQRGAVATWLDGVPLRTLLLLHAIRLPIGVAFLWEASRGQLAPVFADRAGIGDIVIGAVALAVGAFFLRRRLIVIAFSVFGLVDIFVALGTGMYLWFVAQDPLMVAAIARMPYPLLPLGVVPAVIVAHLVVLARRGR
jgi:hypothetical protein